VRERGRKMKEKHWYYINYIKA